MTMGKSRFDARRLMERAIEVMYESVHEPRDDGKSNPLVGALLYLPDGSIETSCRGELRFGDHAEFTLLERKNRNRKLDGGILFATLEPCAPGARHFPKLSCAERIVLARISEVYIGIPDPDPTVNRKGIKYLQDSGVKVHMFDRDLQEEIKKANLAFIEKAIERAKEEESAKNVVLSRFDDPIHTASLNDFSAQALQLYHDRSGIKEELASSAFHRRLRLEGILEKSNDSLLPSGFGILLFGKEPRSVLPQAGLLATIYYPDDTEEPVDFDGPMVMIPEQVEHWLKMKLPSVVDRSHMKRREVPALPFVMIREAVVNALIHRDYEIRGGKCQLIITPDTVTIKSPGGPLPPIQLEQLQSFNAPMLSRNPKLHYIFAKMEMAEERGLGIKSLKKFAEQQELPLPKYTWDDPYLTLTLYRNSKATLIGLPPDVLKSLSDSERKGFQWISTKGQISSRDYADAIQVENRTARRHLNQLIKLGLVRKTGSGPATKYEVM